MFSEVKENLSVSTSVARNYLFAASALVCSFAASALVFKIAQCPPRSRGIDSLSHRLRLGLENRAAFALV